MRKLEADTYNHQCALLQLNETWSGRGLIEALRHLPSNNLASSLDMKFQQKQLQEREQRKVEMISEGGDSNDMSFPSKPFGNGKVRQMFDERRRGPGIDRSNPLKPILTKAKSSIINSTNAVQTRSNAPVIERRQSTLNDRKMNGRRNMVRSEVFEGGNTKGFVDVLNRSVNGMPRRAYEPNRMPDDDRFSKTFSSMSLREKRVSPNEMADRNNNGNNMIKADFSRIQSSQSIKLQPVITKKSPPAFRADTYSSSPREKQTPIVKKQTSLKSSIGKPKRTVGKISSNSQRPPTGMAICRICHRNFNEDRLAKHEEVCQKLANSKRKIFDASKARIKGTEAEQYFKKPIKAAASNRPTMRYSSTAAASGMTLPTKPNNWRKKHEEFIAAIRAAKQVQLHIARGGKLSDLPPPPPSENPDYIQCPHCLRRFNEAAAERHIPKCATMVHNKPKPVASTNKRRN